MMNLEAKNIVPAVLAFLGSIAASFLLYLQAIAENESALISQREKIQADYNKTLQLIAAQQLQAEFSKNNELEAEGRKALVDIRESVSELSNLARDRDQDDEQLSRREKAKELFSKIASARARNNFDLTTNRIIDHFLDLYTELDIHRRNTYYNKRNYDEKAANNAWKQYNITLLHLNQQAEVILQLISKH